MFFIKTIFESIDSNMVFIKIILQSIHSKKILIKTDIVLYVYLVLQQIYSKLNPTCNFRISFCIIIII